jgi:hypothetical protein
MPFETEVGVVVCLYLCLTSAMDGSGWLTQRPDRFIPKKEISYRFYSRLDGPQGRSGRMWWRENLDRSQNKVSWRQNICYLIFETALYNSMECGLTGNDKCLDQALSQCYRSLITAFKLDLDLCNEKVATNHQSTFRVIHIHIKSVLRLKVHEIWVDFITLRF